MPAGSVIADSSISSDNRKWIQAEQNRCLGHNPSAHFFLILAPSLSLSHVPQRMQLMAGGVMGGGRHRRCAHPPMSGRTAVERLLSGALPTCAFTKPGAAVGLLPAVTTTGSSIGGHRGSRERSSERQLEICSHDMWIHPQPAILGMGISHRGESCT
jgi:hypothetical protein